MSDIEVFTRRMGMTTKQTALTRQQLQRAQARTEEHLGVQHPTDPQVSELREILAMLCAPGKPARRAM